jgi:tetratricopeptide (TPR) repeat protein
MLTSRTILTAAALFAMIQPYEDSRADNPVTTEIANEWYGNRDWAKAAQAYEELTTQEPSRGLYWYRLATCRLMLKQYKPALAAYETARDRGAPIGQVRYNMARAYARLDQTDETLKSLEQSAAAGFAKARQISAEEDFASLHNDSRFKALIEKLEHPTKGLKGADAMDHWLGEWDVYANGQRVGQNRIVKSLDGYAVEEFWEDIYGGRGRSLFVFDASKGRWKQLWSSDRGWIVEKIGTPIENGIYLEGTSTLANGTVKKAREYLTRNPDGSVRQLLEDWDDDTKSWKSTFDGKYVRKKSEEKPAKQLK